MYATLVLYTHDTRCPYCTMVTLNYTEASPLLCFLYAPVLWLVLSKVLSQVLSRGVPPSPVTGPSWGWAPPGLDRVPHPWDWTGGTPLTPHGYTMGCTLLVATKEDFVLFDFACFGHGNKIWKKRPPKKYIGIGGFVSFVLGNKGGVQALVQLDIYFACLDGRQLWNFSYFQNIVRFSKIPKPKFISGH